MRSETCCQRLQSNHWSPAKHTFNDRTYNNNKMINESKSNHIWKDDISTCAGVDQLITQEVRFDVNATYSFMGLSCFRPCFRWSFTVTSFLASDDHRETQALEARQIIHKLHLRKNSKPSILVGSKELTTSTLSKTTNTTNDQWLLKNNLLQHILSPCADDDRRLALCAWYKC